MTFAESSFRATAGSDWVQRLAGGPARRNLPGAINMIETLNHFDGTVAGIVAASSADRGAPEGGRRVVAGDTARRTWVNGSRCASGAAGSLAASISPPARG